MSILAINYKIILSGDRVCDFDLKIDRESLILLHEEDFELPEWTKLDFCKCSHCPLNSKEHPRCPIALNLAGTLKTFSKITSYDRVELEVVTNERRITQETSAQQAISSLMGLLIATSGCPHTHFFKPMARFHLPLASEEETIFRSTGNYLLAQYFSAKNGGSFDFDLKGLEEIYRNIETLNLKVVERVRAACLEDSTVNAMIILDFFAKMLPDLIDESMDDIRYMFEPYLKTERLKANRVRGQTKGQKNLLYGDLFGGKIR